MYKKVFVICMLATTLMAMPVYAGGLIKRPDLTIFSPLAVAQSPRAVAMGSAYATAADDVNAAWWNPAGMTGVEKLEVSLSHSQWFVNSTFNTGAIAYTSGVHTIGVSILTFKPEDVEETTILQPGGTGANAQVWAHRPLVSSIAASSRISCPLACDLCWLARIWT